MDGTGMAIPVHSQAVSQAAPPPTAARNTRKFGPYTSSRRRPSQPKYLVGTHKLTYLFPQRPHTERLRQLRHVHALPARPVVHPFERHIYIELLHRPAGGVAQLPRQHILQRHIRRSDQYCNRQCLRRLHGLSAWQLPAGQRDFHHGSGRRPVFEHLRHLQHPAPRGFGRHDCRQGRRVRSKLREGRRTALRRPRGLSVTCSTCDLLDSDICPY